MKNQYVKYENFLFTTIALIIGFSIDSYYSSFVPDFDIGFYEAFAAFRCWALILILWGIVSGILYVLKIHIAGQGKRRLISIAVILIYWLIVWGFCYYQYIVKAMQDWNDMMNGNAG